MRRWDFWKRIIPFNVLFGIVDRCITVYYNSNIEKLEASVSVLPEPTEEQAFEYIGQLYGNLLPMAGLLFLSLLLYVLITSPWQVRRLHDIGMNGSWYLVWLMPTLFHIFYTLVLPFLPEGAWLLPYFLTVPAGIFLFICNIIDSTPGTNRYGESPKYKPFRPLPPVPASCRN